ncbi:MAG: aldo/keto reductase [Abditibacteriales bacterium]|nr:aldo/keto reductase [Abditibacteriales bacterium]MDW8367194.1 aldo/keto reductase [Abditibacteriales bacterium]
MKYFFDFGHNLPTVCRFGLATRGNTHLRAADVRCAVERGINYLNWCGYADGMSQALAEMGAERERVVVAWQMDAVDADAATRALDDALRTLKSDYVDIVTFYYVESEAEWQRIAGKGGAYGAMQKARERGKVRLLGMTSHQRRMAVRIARGEVGCGGRYPHTRTPDYANTRPLDMLMLRYNAAHRGAERDVFPVTDALKIPVVVYTCLRWGALMQPTPDDPPGFVPPPPREWYRFALAHPSVAVALMAPDNRRELDHNLTLLDDWRDPTPEEYATLAAHGERVYRHAGSFP